MTAKLMSDSELIMISCRMPLVALHYLTSSSVTVNPVRNCMVPEVMMVSP